MFNNSYYGLYPVPDDYGYIPGWLSNTEMDTAYEYFPNYMQGLMYGLEYMPVFNSPYMNDYSLPLPPYSWEDSGTGGSTPQTKIESEPTVKRRSDMAAIPRVDLPITSIAHPSGPTPRLPIVYSAPQSDGGIAPKPKPKPKGKLKDETQPTGLRTFTMADFTFSNTARRYNIDNTIPAELEQNALEMLQILQELQEAWGSEIKINSGYRSEALNSKLSGSSDTSVHMLGSAIDIVPANGQFTKFANFCKKWFKDRPFDQLLIEKNSKGSRWIHIGLRNNAGQQRRQVKYMNVK